MNLLQSVTIDTIYLMGGSFVLGSMFTLLLLLVLDIMRREQPPEAK
jgi:hypothetical protein